MKSELAKPENIPLAIIAGILPGVGFPMLLAGKVAVKKALSEIGKKRVEV